MTSRETIISALFTLLQGTAGINTSSRKVKHWSEVTQREQPALFLAQGKETLQAAKMGEPVRHTLTVMVYLYAHTQADSKTAPSQILNPIVDAIEAALHPTFEGTKQTLGGLVVLRWRERDRIGIKSKGLAGETVVFNTSDMPDDVQTVLDTYRKRIPN